MYQYGHTRVNNTDVAEPPATLGTPARRGSVDDVVALLVSQIQGGRYPTGERLPPERELAEELGVARPTLRRALLRLREEGYLVTRRGPHGGNFVSDLARPAEKWLRRLQTDVDHFVEILDYRIAVESHAARLAASRRTEKDLAELEASTNDLKSAVLRASHSDAADVDTVAIASVVKADSRFHEALTTASKNGWLSEGVKRARGELFSAQRGSIYEHVVAATIDDHERIVDAIRRGQADEAAEAMRAHLQHGLSEVLDVIKATC
jgi:GntR family transcriptional regulator, transcriptional repressor for pyruvate dehydrogenase complex